MRKWGVWIGIIGLIGWVSCSKQPDPPMIEVSSSDIVDGRITASENESLTFSVTINAPGGVQALRVSYVDNGKAPDEIQPPEPGAPSFQTTYKLEDWAYGAGPFSIVFTAVDSEGGTSQFSVVIEPGEASIELLESPDVRNDSIIAFTGQQYRVNYRYTFPAGFGSFRLALFADQQKVSESLVTSLPPTQGTSVTDQINQTLNAEFSGMEIRYVMELTPKFGDPVSKEYPVQLSTKPTERFTAISLQPAASNGTVVSFFSSNTGATYSPEVVSQDDVVSEFIDFGYYYDQTDFASLTGPANYPTNFYNVGPNGDNWPFLNVTNFKRTNLSVAAFEAFDDTSQEAIVEAYDNATGGVLLIANQLQEDDVVAFKTSDNKSIGVKHGLFRVISIVPGGTGVGSIVIEVVANQ